MSTSLEKLEDVLMDVHNAFYEPGVCAIVEEYAVHYVDVLFTMVPQESYNHDEAGMPLHDKLCATFSSLFDIELQGSNGGIGYYWTHPGHYKLDYSSLLSRRYYYRGSSNEYCLYTDKNVRFFVGFLESSDYTGNVNVNINTDDYDTDGYDTDDDDADGYDTDDDDDDTDDDGLA